MTLKQEGCSGGLGCKLTGVENAYSLQGLEREHNTIERLFWKGLETAFHCWNIYDVGEFTRPGVRPVATMIYVIQALYLYISDDHSFGAYTILL